MRDAAFTVAWFGLMTMVWLGWAQEDPPARQRMWLGIGSVLGILLAVGFGLVTAVHWDSPSALAGRYAWFGVLVGAEFLVGAVGCGLLALRRRSRWMAWWVAMVVAAHFLPLAWLLADPSIAVIGVVQLLALGLSVRRLRASDRTTSRTVGPVMGGTLLAYAILAGVLIGASAV